MKPRRPRQTPRRTVRLEETTLSVHNERGEFTASLYANDSGETIVGWNDEEAAEAIEDGDLDAGRLPWRVDERALHRSAYDYAEQREMLPQTKMSPRTSDRPCSHTMWSKTWPATWPA